MGAFTTMMRSEQRRKPVAAQQRTSLRIFLPLFFLAVSVTASSAPALAQLTTEAGLNDLVILDPGKHERGLPAVIVEYMDGHPEIDVAPTVHVHRYYFSGNKIFQGPIITGGPVVLVANHPKTGERMYVDVVLPPGAPRIQHTKHAISYLYRKSRVEIKFQHFPFDPCVAVVKHHSGKGLKLALGDGKQHIRQQVSDRLSNSETVNATKELAASGRDLTRGVTATLGEFSTRSVDTIKQLGSLIPGMNYLKSKTDQTAQREYESTIRTAARKNDREEIPFVRTNR